MMQASGGGTPMNAAQLARLQQQLAQYGQLSGQQNPMMNNVNVNAMGGAALQQSQQQQLQQAYMQQQQQQLQQQQQQQQQQGGGGGGPAGGMGLGQRRSPQQLAGMGSNAALAMMQQQQQQQQVAAGNSQMANANMSTYWNALQGGGGLAGPNQSTGGAAMDASSASGAQLAALAGMNMGGAGGAGNNPVAQHNHAASMLLGTRSNPGQGMASQQGMPGIGIGAGGIGVPSSIGVGNQGGVPGLGQTTDASILQQQIAQLQRQLQQQQQQQQQHQQQPQSNQQQNPMAAMHAISGMNRQTSGTSIGNNFQQQQQQHQQQQNPLFQQMQQLSGGMLGQGTSSGNLSQQGVAMGGGGGGIANDHFSMMMQGQNQQQMNGMPNLRDSMNASGGNLMGGGGQGGRLEDQDLLMQQQQLLRGSGMPQGMQGDAQKVQEMFRQQQLQQQQQQNPHADLMGRRSSAQQPMDQQGLGSSMNSQSQRQISNNMAPGVGAGAVGFNTISPFDMDGSMSSQRSNRQSGSAPSHSNDASGTGGGRIMGDNKGDDPANKSFLDGSFAGGWQSNADLPDRRRIIFSILEVIRQMRPDTNKISQKLPHMAKSLEEHLYRSAQTKEEYLDQSTLKKRLQLIAHGLEVHRSTSSGSVQSAGSSSGNQNMHGGSGNVAADSQQLQHFLQMQQGNMGATGNINNHGDIPSMIGGNDDSGGMGQQIDMLQGLGGGGFAGAMAAGEPMNDRIAAQKKKVIRQQQQRLLLLRHASKCKMGPACGTKFCAQMTTLWQHMKKCRDKNCKTSHCLSSRCVLNHYRICKSQGRTATCEVCGPVMEQIKRQDANEGLDSSDPLAAKPDPDLPSQVGAVLDRQMSVFGQADVQQNAQAAQQQVMQQLYQQQQQAIQQNQLGSDMNGMLGNQMQPSLNSLQALGGVNMQGNQMMQGDELSGSQQSGQPSNPQQLQQLQNAQQKLHQQQQVLKQLQKQQGQLLDQQRQLQEQQQQGHQGQQLQQQHALLQQLQRRCQQQQALIQQELMLTMKGIQQQQQSMQGSQSLGSQVLGDNSQQSKHSQMSNTSQNQNPGNHANHNLQGSQVQSHMQVLSQGHVQSLNDTNQSTIGVQQMPNQVQNQLQIQLQNQMMQNQMMQNQMQGRSQLLGLHSPGAQSSLPQPLDDKALDDIEHEDEDDDDEQELLDSGEAVEDPSSLEKAEQDDNDEESESEEQPPEEAEGIDTTSKPLESISQPLSDSSDRSSGSKSKRRSSATRPAPSGGRGKGPRGRGGKGKRLREIADDLMTGSSEGNSLSKSSAEAVAQSVLSSRKRTADAISGDQEGDQFATTDLPAPDTEKSGESKEGDDDASLVSSMPKGDVEQHLLMLHKGLHLTSRTITHKCLPIVQQLIDDPYGWVFRDAVDPVVFGLPDYFEVVKNPMHLLLVKKKLENAVYTDMASFERDVKLVFENAILYNGEESEVGQLAHTMMGVFEKEYKKVCEELNDTITIDPKACTLCGAGRLQFEPPVLYCSGMSCGMSRIKRNAIYHTDAKNQNFWCKHCYSQLKSQELIMLDDGSEIKKSKLLSAKNDSLPEESFLECHDCKGRVHQVCALYNGRKAKARQIFRCPKCILVYRNDDHEPPAPSRESARALPRSKMTDNMEVGLLRALDLAYAKVAIEKGIDIAEVEKAEGLSIRVVSHVQKKHVVRDEMYKKYSKHGCPSNFPVHTKCIGLFQSIRGVDILLFAMYVYEYGQDSPASNRRRVYISYLDSVKYFEPKRYRTVAYQAVVIEYLRFVKSRGFHTAHIWSCPPAPGDEYVFHCHPSHQKVPKESMLRQWYYDILNKAQEDGIVVEATDFYEEYFKNGGANCPLGAAPDPLSLPYFEGDYIPGEIENIVANVNKEEHGGKQPAFRDVVPSLSKRASSGLRSGTRSNPGQLVNQVQDKVMNRLGIAIFNMKENLIIARLRSRSFAAAVERGDDVSEWPDDESQQEIQGKDSSCLQSSDTRKEHDDADVSAGHAMDEVAPAEAEHIADQKGPSGGLAAVVSKMGSTVDEDDQFESELFESRQLFLNYCQANHYQFDEIRRAKHSTMMVLYQLHNPSAPKFVQRCGACQRDIVSGSRYHCSICTNFDLCQECYRPVLTGAWSQRGPSYRHDVSHAFSRISVVDESKDTTMSQENRAKALNAYLEVLTHAAHCDGPPTCRLHNCAKMKQLFVHVETCEVTHSLGCKFCSRLLALIVVHARSCSVRGTCPLPYCDKIRERNERLRQQQLQMDDRRRQAQNAFYQAGEV